MYVAKVLKTQLEVGGPGKGKSHTIRVNPEDYASAGGDVLAIAMVLSWILTYYFLPEIIESNPLKDAVGYNNLCVGWDAAPAKLVAAPMFALIIGLNSRFMQLDFWRACIHPGITTQQYYTVLVTNFLQIISWGVSLLIFVVAPTENAKIHVLSFVQLVVFMYVGYAGNFVEVNQIHHRPYSWVYLAWYGFVTFGFGICAVVQFAMYDAETKTMGPIPWYVTAGFDYAWFATLTQTGRFRPAAPSLEITYQEVSDEDYQVTPTQREAVPLAATGA
eukprot:TRINITY_DN23083_c0_g1_i1.p1 TRINITY_DN23083_c0_g1~~TRINITY_DN23083_c0_g1_i1.p1  ORF type:complete len:275 (+),score=37.19 TRINITY_DN23083_c0_g1_i1:33-857(+)